MDRVRNEEVRRRVDEYIRSESTVLRWFGHVERMYEYLMVER